MQVGLLARLENWLLLGGAGFCPIGGTGAPSSFRCWNVPGVAGVDAFDMGRLRREKGVPMPTRCALEGTEAGGCRVGQRETGPERKAVSDSENA